MVSLWGRRGKGIGIAGRPAVPALKPHDLFGDLVDLHLVGFCGSGFLAMPAVSAASCVSFNQLLSCPRRPPSRGLRRAPLLRNGRHPRLSFLNNLHR
jgi:hypothetical protein